MSDDAEYNVLSMAAYIERRNKAKATHPATISKRQTVKWQESFFDPDGDPVDWRPGE